MLTSFYLLLDPTEPNIFVMVKEELFENLVKREADGDATAAATADGGHDLGGEGGGEPVWHEVEQLKSRKCRSQLLTNATKRNRAGYGLCTKFASTLLKLSLRAVVVFVVVLCQFRKLNCPL